MNSCRPLLVITLAIILLSHASLVGHAQEGTRFEPVMTLQERVVAPLPQVAEMMRYEDAQGGLSAGRAYTMQGWLKSITSDYFKQSFCYATGSDNPSYTGRISAKQTGRSGISSTYNYSYDKLGRLVSADYSCKANAKADYSASYQYDLEANISRLLQHGLVEPGTFGVLDEIVVKYDGSQIVQTAHGEAHAYESSSGNIDVKDGYAYDANGNLTTDPGRGIESIVYNRINMPRRINFDDGEWIEFVYQAEDTKLSMTVPYSFGVKPWPGIYTPADSLGKYPLNARAAGAGKKTTNYVGSYETENVRFDRLNLPGGYVTVADSVYHWYLTDYQGNICGVVNTATKELEQCQEYYPYGKPYAGGQGESINRRKFGGKELLTGKGYDAYDFEARPLTITLTRFTQPDPLAETYYPISIYAYCAGDSKLNENGGQALQETV